MVQSLFKKNVIDWINHAKNNPGIPLSRSPKLQKYINALQQGKSYLVGGRESGGKRSFADMFFVLDAYINWLALPEATRPPLKIIYFNMDKPLHIKMQKWVCTCMWFFYAEFIDINTLTGGAGRIYDLDADTITKIESIQSMFDTMISSGILSIVDGRKRPISIYSEIVETVKPYGVLEQTDYAEAKFVYSQGYENMITLAIIENVDKLSNETKSGEAGNDFQLHTLMSSYMESVKRVYKVSPVIIIPSFKFTGATLKKDMVPDYREFQNYYRDADVAINCFNPSMYRDIGSDWHGYSIVDLITKPDNIGRFRTIHILRNTNGVDNIVIPYLFYPENGVFEELISPNDPRYPEFQQNLSKFKVDYINYKNSLTVNS